MSRAEVITSREIPSTALYVASDAFVRAILSGKQNTNVRRSETKMPNGLPAGKP